VRKVADIADLVNAGCQRPQSVFKRLRQLAASEDWKTREVAATGLVEISKKHAPAVIAEMMKWAKATDPHVRRAASEGLREVARRKPESITAILDSLHGDPDLYVRKSVANVLRNAGNYRPDFVLNVATEWSKTANAHTAWTIRDGLKKLVSAGNEEAIRLSGLMC